MSQVLGGEFCALNPSCDLLIKAVQNLGKRGIVLRQGKLVFDGNAKEAVDCYVHSVYGDSKGPGSQIINLTENGNRAAKFKLY